MKGPLEKTQVAVAFNAISDLSEVGGGWPLKSKGIVLTSCTVIGYSFGYAVRVPFAPCEAFWQS